MCFNDRGDVELFCYIKFYHFPILLDDCQNRINYLWFKNMWLKLKGFEDLLKGLMGLGFHFSDSYSTVLVFTLKFLLSLLETLGASFVA